MHVETVKELWHASPFVPFHIYMADGQSYFIDHPDFVGISRGASTVMVSTEGDRIAMLDASLISRLERTQNAGSN